MPIVTIKARERDSKLDLKKVANKLSVLTGEQVGRFHVFANYLSADEYFNAKNDCPLIIHVEASENNGKETIQNEHLPDDVTYVEYLDDHVQNHEI